jgi:hypothetical protein
MFECWHPSFITCREGHGKTSVFVGSDPRGNKAGKTTIRISFASPCSSSVDVSVELPERITSGPRGVLRMRDTSP